MVQTPDLPQIPPQTNAAERWRALVERRRVQMDTAYAQAEISSGDYWARRAPAYRAAMHRRTDADPFFLRVKEHVSRQTTVIDVGAGTGRHTIALAPFVRRVVAVDPSEAMLGLLRQDVAAESLSNVDTVLAEWMQADVEPADVVICSHVLYPIADVVPFIEKLQAHARRRVWVYLRVDPLPTDLGLWSEFYGTPLQAQPVLSDLYPVLLQLDIAADVKVVEHRFTLTYESVDEAVTQARHSLCLREDDDQATSKLRGLLDRLLVPHEGGRIGPPIESTRSAMISWIPRKE